MCSLIENHVYPPFTADSGFSPRNLVDSAHLSIAGMQNKRYCFFFLLLKTFVLLLLVPPSSMDKRAEGREKRREGDKCADRKGNSRAMAAAASAAHAASIIGFQFHPRGWGWVGYSPTLPDIPLFYLQYNGCRLQQTDCLSSLFPPFLSRHKRGSNNDTVMGWVGTMDRRERGGRRLDPPFLAQHAQICLL